MPSLAAAHRERYPDVSSLNDLTAEEREVLRRSLVAAAEGPYFPDWEFQTLFGVTRAEVSDVVRAWQCLDESHDVFRRAINNALVHLIHYPHGQTLQLERELGVTTAQLEKVFAKWRRS